MCFFGGEIGVEFFEPGAFSAMFEGSVFKFGTAAVEGGNVANGFPAALSHVFLKGVALFLDFFRTVPEFPAALAFFFLDHPCGVPPFTT